MTAAPSMFALEQNVEVFDYVRWLPATITAILLTPKGLFYEVQGTGFSASVGPAALRAVGNGMPGRIVALTWTGEGIFYQIEGARHEPRGLQVIATPAANNV
jgi:hypothetical protein